MIGFFQKLFGCETEMDIIKRKYPEVLLYEEYKSKYSDKLKLIIRGDRYSIIDANNSKPYSLLCVVDISEVNAAKYSYVKTCISRFETDNSEIEV